MVSKSFFGDEWEITKFKNYFNYVTNQSFNLTDENSLIKILAFYKLNSFFYKTLNAMLRMSSKVSDFKFIALPFSQLQQTIKHFYIKKLK